jgi:RNA polymerase sigma factor (sigma-70 family)
VTSDRRNKNNLEEAFEKRSGQLRWIALRAGEQEAEDVIQDAFLKVVETSQREEVRTLDNLLSRIVRRVAISNFRRRKTRVDYARSEIGEGAVDPAADPERALMGAQRLQRVMAVIDAMPLRRREVFLMHRVDELTYPQIARRAGISVKAVEKHMHLAMRQLSDADD